MMGSRGKKKNKVKSIQLLGSIKKTESLSKGQMPGTEQQ